MEFIDEIQDSLHNPEALEKLYRLDEKQFRLNFDHIFKAHPYEPILQVWYQRLNYVPPRAKPGNQGLFWWAFPLALMAAVLTRWMWDLHPSQFFINALLLFPSALAVSIYLSVAKGWGWKLRVITALIFVGILSFFYFMPFLIHEPWYTHKISVFDSFAPVILLFFIGFVYTGPEGVHTAPRLEFIKSCGAGLIFAMPLVIGGLLLLAFGFFLFRLLGYEVMDLNANISILLVAGAAIPVAAAHMVETQGFMVKNILALLAKIFTPVLFIITVAFLVLMGLQNNSVFQDRDFLIIFNLALLLVLGMTLLSLSDLRGDQKPVFGDVLLFALIVVGVIIAGISLGTVAYRLASFTVTPIKLALLGFDITVLVHFIWILLRYIGFLRGKHPITKVQIALTGYLPVYLVGAVIGLGVLPFL